MAGAVRRTSALLLLTVALSGCSASRGTTEYLSSMRTVERKLPATRLTDQQLVALGKTICRDLSAGQSRKRQVELAVSRLGNVAAGSAAYLLAIQVLCPNQAGQ